MDELIIGGKINGKSVNLKQIRDKQSAALSALSDAMDALAKAVEVSLISLTQNTYTYMLYR